MRHQAREDDLGCQSIRYSLWRLTAFTLHLLRIPKHRVSFQHWAVSQLNSLSSCQGTKGPECKNRFYDKVRTPLAWWHSRNQSEISPFGILMKEDVCVCRNAFLLIRGDTFCHWLPDGLCRRCILLCTRNSSRLFISDSIDAYFSADVSLSCS